MLENQRPHRSCVNCTHFFLQQMKIFVGFFCVAFLKNLQFIFAIASLCAILFTFEVVAYRSTHIFGSALLVPNYYCCSWWWCYCASSFELFPLVAVFINSRCLKLSPCLLWQCVYASVLLVVLMLLLLSPLPPLSILTLFGIASEAFIPH